MNMNCMEFRRLAGADPHNRSSAFLAHRLECRACAEYAREQALLDRRLEAALRIPVPVDLPARTLWRQASKPRRRGWLVGLAAGVMLVIGAGLVVSQLDRIRPLPTAVVAHIEHEPELLLPTSRRAGAVQVSAVLQRGGMTLSRDLPDVVHAGLCPFRGRLVPHLVLERDGETISVLLLAHEPVLESRAFTEGGYSGVIMSHQHGSIAIVAAREDLLVPVGEQLETTVNWRL